MILYPAIDLKDGLCVRLKQGEMSSATVYNERPSNQAADFDAMGFEWIHIVDLNGAFAGVTINGIAIQSILANTKLKIQLGGGIRTIKAVEDWVNRGVSRVILGTAAVRTPEFVREAAKAFPGKIAIGLDTREGKVAISGWAEMTDMSYIELAKHYEDCGIAAIIHTDIARDGLLGGLNLTETKALAEAVSIPVIASGGLGSMDDIERLCATEMAILNGAIAGRAIYDGRLNPVEALARLKARAEQ